MRMQDYKSLCAAVTICATLVNIQTHIQTDSILPAYMKAKALTPRHSPFPFLVLLPALPFSFQFLVIGLSPLEIIVLCTDT